jgi:sigma-B regulation protein RsbU (phosphoserine phosphatase)
LILVIEDDESTRETTARILRLAGHTVLTAADGQEGLSILEHERPSLILCDLRMPTIDGQTFRLLQRQSPVLAAIPFVVMSAAVTVHEDAAELDAAMILVKPVDLDDIIRCAQTYDPRPDRTSAKAGDPMPGTVS